MNQPAGSKSFVDSPILRLIALLFAALFAWLLWSNYADNFKALMAGKGDTAETTLRVSASEPAKPANEALEACLAQRVGDVDKMKKEGILSDAQYSSFRGRAEELCRAQNPGA